MKQYKITTENLNQDTDEDCYLDSSDPIHELKAIQHLAGLNRHLKEYKGLEGSNISGTGNEKGQLMKRHNIKPGTPEWFQLWFSLPYLTGEKPVGK